MRDELRNWSDRDADAMLLAEGTIRHTVMRGVFGIAGVASPGHAYQGISREPRRAPCFSAYLGSGAAQPKDTWSPGNEGCPEGSEQALDEEKPVAKGDRRRQLRVDEQSYDSIVPMKVENRRAPARGGHGIHWREGMNRLTYRCSDTGPRPRTREGMFNGTESNS